MAKTGTNSCVVYISWPDHDETERRICATEKEAIQVAIRHLDAGHKVWCCRLVDRGRNIGVLEHEAPEIIDAIMEVAYYDADAGQYRTFRCMDVRSAACATATEAI